MPNLTPNIKFLKKACHPERNKVESRDLRMHDTLKGNDGA